MNKALIASKKGIDTFYHELYNSVLFKIKGIIQKGKGEVINGVYSFDGREPHGGQILKRKVLPNGYIKEQLITAYCGDGTPMHLESIIRNKDGEIVSAASGVIRGNLSKGYIDKFNKSNMGVTYTSLGTVRFKSTISGNTVDEVAKNAKLITSLNPSVKNLSYSPQGYYNRYTYPIVARNIAHV